MFIFHGQSLIIFECSWLILVLSFLCCAGFNIYYKVFSSICRKRVRVFFVLGVC